MQMILSPGLLQGSITAPPSKSHAQRLLICSALSTGVTRVGCPSGNEDLAAAVRCLTALGAGIRRNGTDYTVTGMPGTAADGVTLDCGGSASVLRFLLPLCAARGDRATLTGSDILRHRPHEPLLDALRRHGADLSGNTLPVTVSGRLHAGEWVLPGNVSSQFFSGLLLALPLLDGDSTLRFIPPLQSRPYIGMTLEVMRSFGVRVQPLPDGWYIRGHQCYTSPGAVQAEGDWSAAAFWYAANRLGSSVRVLGLREDSCQGDRVIGELLQRIGSTISVADTPDLVPPLAVAAACIPGAVTRITEADRLKLKESDRLNALTQLINDLGGDALKAEDGLLIRGRTLRGGAVDGQMDHRVIMSAAIAATVCRDPVTIQDAEAVGKSYPGFFDDFIQLKGNCHE